MHWNLIYQGLAAAILSQALIIPTDITADGVYAAVNKADGTEVHTKVVDVTDNGNIHALDRRFSSQYFCGCGYYMNHDNCDAAVQDLRNQFGGGSKSQPGLSFYSIRGDIVAFACSREATTAYQWTSDDIARSYTGVTARCGFYVAGTLQIFDTFFGYMQYSNGIDFCRDSSNSNA
jgi:hypothetical protein